MTTITIERAAQPRLAPARIPMSRLVGVELRKMFDTRSGFWLMASIVIAAVLATGASILFAPDDQLTYSTFAASIGFPMAVILPMIAILSVASEWSQRSGLTTFTMIPHRGRVIWAKAISAVAVAVVSILIALVVGAGGNILGATINGTPRVGDMSVTGVTYIVIGNILGLLVGFMLGVLIRNSSGAIVAYFVYSLLLPTLFSVLAAGQHWFHQLQPWVDFNFAQGALFNGSMSSQQWANLATAGSLWLVAPLVVGLTLMMRSEVK